MFHSYCIPVIFVGAQLDFHDDIRGLSSIYSYKASVVVLHLAF